MKNHFGYVRVSTAKQGEGVSIGAQKEAIEQYAKTNNLIVSQWFEEKETAAKAGRPVFNAMVKQLRKQKAQGIIVHKIDRSARNFRDWARIGDLADAGFDIHFATETLDFRSRGGRLSADIQAVIAADYIRNLREETIKGINGRLKQGLYPFNAPLGYLNNGGGKPKTPDPERAPLIKKMFELYASGNYSLRTLRHTMIDLGLTNTAGKPPSKHLIETILSNPFYCGIIRIKTTGKTYEGAHAPLISVAQFERVQDAKSGKCGKKVTKHNHIFRGLFRCGHCNYSMIPERQKGHVYYRCHTKNCPTTTVREQSISSALFETYDALALSEEAIEQLVCAVQKWTEKQSGSENRELQITSELSNIDNKLEALTDALIDRLIGKEVYAERQEKLLLRKSELNDELNKNVNLNTTAQDVREFLELAKNLTQLYKNLPAQDKRRFIESTTSNRVVADKNLVLEPSDWLQAIPSKSAAPDGDPGRPKTRTTFGISYSKSDKVGTLSAKEIERLMVAASNDNLAPFYVDRSQEVLGKQTEEQRVQQWKKNLKNHPPDSCPSSGYLRQLAKSFDI